MSRPPGNTRHARQAKLREIGESGQARLAAAEVRVTGDGLASEIEARYLAGAGVSLVVEADTVAGAARDVDPEVPLTMAAADPASRAVALPFVVRDGAAREVARGAYAALRALRVILGRGVA